MHQAPIQSVSLRPLHRLRAILIDRDFEFSELFNGAMTAVCGAWFLLPFTTFGSTPTFAAMRDLAPEAVWGIAMVALGIVQLVGLIADWWRWRRWSAMASCGVWIFLSVLVVRSNPASPDAGMYFLLALSAAWAYLRMRFHRMPFDEVV